MASISGRSLGVCSFVRNGMEHILDESRLSWLFSQVATDSVLRLQ